MPRKKKNTSAEAVAPLPLEHKRQNPRKEVSGRSARGVAGKAHVPFPVVALGASAESLNAFREFFAALPKETGASFIVVQHFDHGRKSLLNELLSRLTSLPVCVAEDGMSISPDHVYVNPPSFAVRIEQGKLHLDPMAANGVVHHTLDYFFTSLAKHSKQSAIGVLLSGPGNDGVVGLRAIKEAGGLAIAQDPQTAEHSSMPAAAISAGVADCIDAPGKIPGAIQQYIRDGFVYCAPDSPEDTTVIANALDEILNILSSHTGKEFRNYKKSTLVRRIQRRIHLSRMETPTEYILKLKSDPNSAIELAQDLLIGVTSFFRDPDAWTILSKEVVRPIINSHPVDRPMRLWVPACSTGEEAYSLAIVFAEQLKASGRSLGIQLFATDVDETALDAARSGVYSGAIELEVSEERLKHFFVKKKDGYHIAKALRDMVVFTRHDLITDPPFSKLNLISCRNMLIYMDHDFQRKVIPVFHFALNPEGYLFLGSSESISIHKDLFKPVSKKWRIFARLATPARQTSHFPILPNGENLPAARSGALPATELSEEKASAAAAVLKHLLPATVIIAEDFRILYYQKDVENFLDISRGILKKNLLMVTSESYREKLRFAVHKARTTEEQVTFRHVTPNKTGTTRTRVAVIPVEQKPFLFIVTFVEEPAGTLVPRPEILEADAGNARRLEDELVTTKAELKTIINELEHSNEELKASHEQIVAINDELHASNEALENTKQELLSLNEELITTNKELKEKIGEVEITRDDLNNLLVSTSLATLFLDTRFRIKRFTEAAVRLFNLIPGDVGRPVADLSTTFSDDLLLSDAQKVLDQSLPLQKEIQTNDGRWYLRRILPYRTQDNQVQGVVITLSEITDVKQVQNFWRNSEERYRCLTGILSAVVWNTDATGAFTTQQQSWELYTGQKWEDYKGWGWTNALHDDDRTRIAAQWRAALSAKKTYEVEGRLWHAQSASYRHFRTRAAPIFNEDGTVREWMGCVMDIDDTKRADIALLESERRFRTMADSAPVFIWIQDSTGHLTYLNKPYMEFIGGTLESASQYSLLELVHPDDRELVATTLENAVKNGQRFQIEYRMRRQDGKTRWLLDHGEPLLTQPGCVTGFIGTCIDITERRKAEDALRLSEERFSTALAASSVTVFSADRDLRYTWMSKNSWIDSESVVGKLPQELPGSISVTFANDLKNKVISSGESLREVLKFKVNGEDRYFHYSVNPARDQQGEIVGIMCATTDVTADHKGEEERAFLAAIVESSNDAIIGLTLEGVITSWNRGAERIYGFTRAEMVGQSLSQILPKYKATNLTKALHEIALQKKAHIFETSWDRKDVNIYILFNITPVMNPLGEVIAASAIGYDITEQKRAERQLQEVNTTLERRVAERTHSLVRYQEQLRELASQLSMIEQVERRRLATDLHDFLAQQLIVCQMKLAQLKKIVTAERGKELLQQTNELLHSSLKYTRTLVAELSPTILYEAGLTPALHWLGEQMHQHGLTVAVEADDEEISISDDEAILVFQAVRELLFNVTKHAKTDKARISLKYARPGELEVMVSDKGVGFDPDKVAPITATGGRYGLFNVRERIEAVGGSFGVESKDSLGTVVVIRLPITRKKRNAQKSSGNAVHRTGVAQLVKRQPNGPIRLMLVDDHEIVREGLRSILKPNADMQIIGEAYNGEVAVSSALQLQPDVILMDLNMPKMNGIEATRALKEKMPEIMVIGFSVYDDRELAASMKDAGAFAYLIKGCPPEELFRMIRKAWHAGAMSEKK